MWPASGTASEDAENSQSSINVESLLQVEPGRSSSFTVIKRTLVGLALVSCTTATAATQATRRTSLLTTTSPIPIKLQAQSTLGRLQAKLAAVRT